MAKTFDSIDELMKYVQKDVQDTMNRMKDTYASEQDNPKYVLMQHIDEDFYGEYSPRQYTNTYELRDSVEATRARKLGDTIEVGLYHNKDKFTVDPDNWQHGSNYSDKDMTVLLPEIINEGSKRWGYIFGDGDWRKPRPYIQFTADDLRSGRLKCWLKGKLESKGWNVV